MILTVTLNPAIDKVYFVDNYRLGKVSRPKKIVVSAGGKGLNVARVSNIIGAKVGATGFVGGNSGQFIKSEVTKQGIEDKFISINGETRTCINVSDESNGLSTEILEPGPKISEKEAEDFLNEYKEMIKPYNIITLSGSLPQGLPKDYYRKLIKEAKIQNKKVLLDSSGDYLLEGLKEKPTIIKPNEDEIKSITGVSSYEEFFNKLVELGIQYPVVTLGKNGCLALIDNKIYHFISPKIKVVNSVGSGDSFIAGFAVGLDKGYDIESTIKLAMSCGAANATYSQTGLVDKELVKNLFKKVTKKAGL